MRTGIPLSAKGHITEKVNTNCDQGDCYDDS